MQGRMGDHAKGGETSNSKALLRFRHRARLRQGPANGRDAHGAPAP